MSPDNYIGELRSIVARPSTESWYAIIALLDPLPRWEPGLTHYLQQVVERWPPSIARPLPRADLLGFCLDQEKPRWAPLANGLWYHAMADEPIDLDDLMRLLEHIGPERITSLRIQCLSLGQDGSELLASILRYLHNLHELVLARVSTGPDHFMQLFTDQPLGSLRKLVLQYSSMGRKARPLLEILAQSCPHLSQLGLLHCDLGVGALNAIFEEPWTHSLRCLDLQGNHLSALHNTRLADHSIENRPATLRRLRIASRTWSHEDFQILTRSAHLQHLQELCCVGIHPRYQRWPMRVHVPMQLLLGAKTTWAHSLQELELLMCAESQAEPTPPVEDLPASLRALTLPQPARTTAEDWFLPWAQMHPTLQLRVARPAQGDLEDWQRSAVLNQQADQLPASSRAPEPRPSAWLDGSLLEPPARSGDPTAHEDDQDA